MLQFLDIPVNKKLSQTIPCNNYAIPAVKIPHIYIKLNAIVHSAHSWLLISLPLLPLLLFFYYYFLYYYLLNVQWQPVTRLTKTFAIDLQSLYNYRWSSIIFHLLIKSHGLFVCMDMCVVVCFCETSIIENVNFVSIMNCSWTQKQIHNRKC